jgi:hypothetical protein
MSETLMQLISRDDHLGPGGVTAITGHWATKDVSPRRLMIEWVELNGHA